MAMLMLEQAASLHEGKDAPYSGLPRAQCPRVLNIFLKFFKNFDNFVKTDHTSEKFFDGNSNSRKAKMTVCMRW
jgi:hypothetical protein